MSRNTPASGRRARLRAAVCQTSFASANKTVQRGAVSVRVNQDGSRNLIFVREVTEGADKYTMTAMVSVSDEGKVSLAIYMGGKKKK